MILGNFIVAFGYEYKWPWEAIVIIGYTCAGKQFLTWVNVGSFVGIVGKVFV